MKFKDELLAHADVVAKMDALCDDVERVAQIIIKALAHHLAGSRLRLIRRRLRRLAMIMAMMRFLLGRWSLWGAGAMFWSGFLRVETAQMY